MITIIVALAKNNAIGKDNQLLWHISEDLQRFKKITMNRKIIMGRNTLLSLPKWPLPKRTNIVITDNPEEKFEGCIMAHSIADALKYCNSGEECFVIGGASVYRQFLTMADKLYITRIDKEFDGDTFFPEIDVNTWKLTDKSHDIKMEDGSFIYWFETYLRRQ
jgi:dihydrofolate reductase